MSWIKQKSSSLFILTISFVAGVVLFEGGLRLFTPDDAWLKLREGNILRNFQFEYLINDLYEHDLPSAEYIRDEYGLRDNCESPDEIKILTIGGSTTDQRYVPLSSTYQSVLEERLSAHLGYRYCVSNAGVDGHSTWGHLFSFDHWFPLIPGLKPKFVLLYVGLNDVDFQRAIAPASGFDTNSQNGFKALLKKSLIVNSILLPIYRFLNTSLENKAGVGHALRVYSEDDYSVNVMNKQTVSLSEENAKAFRSRLQILLAKVSSLDAIPICVTQPHRFTVKKHDESYGLKNIRGYGFSGIDFDHSLRQLNIVMFELCGENTIDLYNHSFASSHFYDGVHTTASGSREVGNRLADFIIARLL